MNGMDAVVLGNGRSGKAAAELLRREGWFVRILDGNDPWPDDSWNLCVTSPGVPLDHRWQKSAREAGVPVISELQLGAERYRAMGGRMLAVTGSKGKSSVVKLVADALDGIPCGNYGTPLCEVVLDARSAPNSPLRYAVVEVSSFQLETTHLPSDTFEAATILNLQEDHLDRHGSVETYHALKRRLLDFATVKIVGTDPKTLRSGPKILGTDPNKAANDFSLFRKSYFDNAILRDNGLRAVLLLRAVGLDDKVISSAFARFEPLPHRMQTVGLFGGVTWIDDSKATSLAALVAGVTITASRFSGSVPKVRLIAGGLPKGDDPNQARDCLAEGVCKVYLIGHCASLWEQAWKEAVPCEVCGTLERAVESAIHDAEKGDCILLSPGAASFDQFKSYGERGNCFSDLALTWGQTLSGGGESRCEGGTKRNG